MNRTYKLILQHKGLIIDVAAFVGIACFLLSYFKPEYLLSKTITTGGDTASHYYSAKYLSENLLPQGKIVGWTQGNYCGFPMFLFYFPLPFVIMAFLDLFMPLQIAFKLVTVLGIFALPLCVYYALKFINYRFPIPIIGAFFALPFLFMEANSMWGGNIPSTLAGEFNYSIGLSLAILFAGTLYRGITTNRMVIINAFMVFFIGFSHGYTLLFVILMSSFFLITIDDFVRKLFYLLKVHLLGFCLLAFWLIPLICNTPYTTRYNSIWYIGSIFEVFPKILLPIIALAIIGLIIALIQKSLAWYGAAKLTRDEQDVTSNIQHTNKDGDKGFDIRIYYIWFCVVISAILYLIAYRINVVDIRFLPFLQIFLMIAGAIGVYNIIKRLRYQWIIALVVVPGTFLWVDHNVNYISDWIPWNYEGFEGKSVWPAFKGVNEYLSGTPNDPRVVYEHSSLHNAAGTPRAFESLPLFSGRSTLEGLYMQSSITAPFSFYIQSEISKERSCPFPDYNCTQLDLENAIQHLEMFNVKDFIVRSDEVKKAIKEYPEFLLKKTIPPYEIYELTTNENRYVVPLQYKPVLLVTNNWKMASYKWFKDHEQNDVHLVFRKESDHIDDLDLDRFKMITRAQLHSLPRIPTDTAGFIEEEIKDDEILIRTDMINKPVMIKISYHPNWKVEGADKIYLVSPSFMLIYPNREHVRLYYGKRFPDHLGKFLTLAVIAGLVIGVPLAQRRRKVKGQESAKNGDASLSMSPLHMQRPTVGSAGKFSVKTRLIILISSIAFIIGSLTLFIVVVQQKDPAVLLANGIRLKDKKKYSEAAADFLNILTEFPEVSRAYEASYYYAICFYLQGDNNKAIEAFEKLILDYYDGIWVPEAYYHIGLCKRKIAQSSVTNRLKLQEVRLQEVRLQESRAAFEHVVSNFPMSIWAKYSKDRLREMR
ncbi:MAG: 6-pyruvoyl-tetrahydropterin synthase-related protein [Candidatus Anammoxibacter sp.]